MTQTPGSTLEGRLDSITDEKLVMTCSGGQRHEYAIAEDAEVTCDGMAGRTADLAVGIDVRVTCHKDDGSLATAVRADTGIPTMG